MSGKSGLLDKIKLYLAYRKNRRLKEEEYPAALMRWFQKEKGYAFDPASPSNYNEKIQWLKLYDTTPLKTRLSDKVLVRDWVSERVGDTYLIPLLGVWDSFEEIDFNTLPDKFVLKTNHGSGWNMVVPDKAALDKRSASRKFRRWLGTNFAFLEGLELQYRDIVPKLLAEEFIENGGNNLYDYKIHCFSGEPKLIEYIGDRLSGDPRELYLDPEWKRVPQTDGVYPRYGETPPKPEQLPEMLRIAKALSRDFCYVRVDLYLPDDGRIRFGEMTFTPGSGKYNWDPPEYNRIMGEMITLPPRPENG